MIVIIIITIKSISLSSLSCSLCSAISATLPIHSPTCLLHPWYSTSSSSSSSSSSSLSSSSSSLCWRLHNTSRSTFQHLCISSKRVLTEKSERLHSGVNDGPVLHWKDLFHKSFTGQGISRSTLLNITWWSIFIEQYSKNPEFFTSPFWYYRNEHSSSKF